MSFINNNISDLLNDINLDTHLKLYVLLYADDTVILVENPRELQLALDAIDQYCTLWKLKINVSKTKVLVFSRGYVRNRPEFTFGNVKLKIVRDYQYLFFMGNLTKQNKIFLREVVGQCSLYYVKLGVYFYLLMFFLNCLTI